MALIPTTKSKISNLLSILTATHKTPSLASASYSNGAARKFRVAPFGGSGRSLSSSVAPLESDMVSLKDYEEYRKALYGGITHKALLVDAVGTLVLPSQPMAQIGEKYGIQYSETKILNRYRKAYEQPWGRSRLRYVNDGRPFWQYIVSSSTGCSDSQYFEELYNYYTTKKAWHLCDPDAEKVFKTLRNAGVKLAVVSNFDTRLRPVLRALNCDYWCDTVAVSAEVEAEKPNPTIFIKACELLGVKPEDVVHVGDDCRNDIWGARDAGCDAWLWRSDVHSFKENMEELGRWSNIRYG
ncbi:haloacid dehalogenase-like hydrolase domain-containing protein 3 isoform X1 [Camellia sinensis]|uniref:haloacid dehalogenase-like hydrolase domain-containing protein 3 isoform X1 n=1 Tax=Camellia sinensis TaxID=4442 RepID=UPI001036A2CE|nr:haloacid dehalogenase-like hydrolase domain-containing protein 3 isoform X1 [Camellia sinensis]